MLGFLSSNWQHQRIEQELQNARTLSDKRREADHRRALKYNEKKLATGENEPSKCQGENHRQVRYNSHSARAA